MSQIKYGYRYGPSRTAYLPVDSSSADISAGDLLAWGTAGFVQRAAAGDLPMGVSYDDAASPANDGDVSVLVELSDQAIFAYPPDAGSVTQGLVGKTMDLGGPQSIDIDASVDDVVVVEDADADQGVLYVRFLFEKSLTGIV